MIAPTVHVCCTYFLSNCLFFVQWHALDRSEQAKYYEMAREERARHMQMYPGWSARDNYAVHKKRRKKKVKQVNEPVEEDNGESTG